MPVPILNADQVKAGFNGYSNVLGDMIHIPLRIANRLIAPSGVYDANQWKAMDDAIVGSASWFPEAGDKHPNISSGAEVATKIAMFGRPGTNPGILSKEASTPSTYASVGSKAAGIETAERTMLDSFLNWLNPPVKSGLTPYAQQIMLNRR